MLSNEERQLIMAVVLGLLGYLYNDFLGPINGPVVEISGGKIQGNLARSRDGSEYFEFLGIPFAQPPIGQLRFESPLRAKSWEGILETKNFKPECMQLEVMISARILGSEDCLYLNVFAPKFEKGENLKPVMVFFHGGLWMAGSSNFYRGKYFMTNKSNKVILVTLNYRLASLGFLNSGDGVVKGNMGLKDQNLALVWVKENIKAFGGNPHKVTIFGESAGGASVHYHMLSPMSKGLFSKGISQSGTASKIWALNRDPGKQSKHLAKSMNCPIHNTEVMVQCLKSIDARKLVQIHINSMPALRENNDIYVPTVEKYNGNDAFLTKHPDEIFKSGNYTKVPWIIGVNSHEGLMTVGRILANETITENFNNNWSKWAPIILDFNNTNIEATNRIRNFYFGSGNSRTSVQINPKSQVDILSQLFSDRIYFQPTANVAKISSNYAPTYLYYFSYPTEFSFFNIFKAVSGTGWLPMEFEIGYDYVKDFLSKYVLRRSFSKNLGPCHADELFLFFNMHILSEINTRSNDYLISEAMINLWRDFAHNHTNMVFEGSKWTPIAPNKTLTYMHLDKKGGLINDPNEKSINFWNSLGL